MRFMGGSIQEIYLWSWRRVFLIKKFQLFLYHLYITNIEKNIFAWLLDKFLMLSVNTKRENHVNASLLTGA